ncbi:MAG: serine hydrolase domain-containing protein [Ferrimicrobium sp.]
MSGRTIHHSDATVDPESLLELGESLVYGSWSGGVRTLGEVNADREVPWASVTKLLTSIAVFVAIEEGVLGEHEPLGDYGLDPIDLLAHCSGLATGRLGEASLSEPGKVEPSVAPLTRRIYSNIGYELLAVSIAAASGMPFGEYLREGVLEPLGMDRSHLDPAALGGRGAVGGAFAMVGPIREMVQVVAGLTDSIVIGTTSLTRIRTPVSADLAGVLPGYGVQEPNPWGAGAEIRGYKRPHWTGTRCSPVTFGHFGQSGTFCWIDPVAKAFCIFGGVQPFGGWAVARWPRIGDAVLDQIVLLSGSGDTTDTL